MTERDIRQDNKGGVSGSVRAEAARWFEAVNRGDLRSAEAAAFRTWLQADPSHAGAYRAVEQAWRDLALLDDAANWIGAAASEYVRPEARRKDSWLKAAWLPALAACLVVAVAVLAFAPWRLTAEPSLETFQTAIAQTQAIELEDGSRVVLGAESAMDVAYTAQARTVVLKQGVAYFEVTPNAGRPFVVQAGPTQVTVVGTAFETWMGPDGTRVSVGEGKVRVGRSGDAASGQVRLLTAGEQVFSDRTGAPGEIVSFDPGETLAWREGRFIYTDVPLRTVIADINRYRRLKVDVDGAGLGDMHVSAAFNTGDTDGFLAGFAEAEGMRIENRDGRTMLFPQ